MTAAISVGPAVAPAPTTSRKGGGGQDGSGTTFARMLAQQPRQGRPPAASATDRPTADPSAPAVTDPATTAAEDAAGVAAATAAAQLSAEVAALAALAGQAAAAPQQRTAVPTGTAAAGTVAAGATTPTGTDHAAPSATGPVGTGTETRAAATATAGVADLPATTGATAAAGPEMPTDARPGSVSAGRIAPGPDRPATHPDVTDRSSAPTGATGGKPAAAAATTAATTSLTPGATTGTAAAGPAAAPTTGQPTTAQPAIATANTTVAASIATPSTNQSAQSPNAGSRPSRTDATHGLTDRVRRGRIAAAHPDLATAANLGAAQPGTAAALATTGAAGSAVAGSTDTAAAAALSALTPTGAADRATAGNPTAAAAAPAAPAEPVARQLAAPVLDLQASGDGVHRMTIALHPLELGQVNVHVRIVDGSMSIHLASADAGAHEAIRSALGELHRELQSAGLSGVDVSVDQRSGGSADFSAFSGRQDDNRPPAAAPGSTRQPEAPPSQRPDRTGPRPSVQTELDRWL